MMEQALTTRMAEEAIPVAPAAGVAPAPGAKPAQPNTVQVKDPIPGRYDWVFDLDLTSMYPNTIIIKINSTTIR